MDNAFNRGLLGLRPGGGLGFGDVRHDGSGLKGKGYFGPLTNQSGNTMTEYTVGENIGGREMEIPSIVPTLSPEQLGMVLGGKIDDGIASKARAHALFRLLSGSSPFADKGLYMTPGMLGEMER